MSISPELSASLKSWREYKFGPEDPLPAPAPRQRGLQERQPTQRYDVGPAINGFKGGHANGHHWISEDHECTAFRCLNCTTWLNAERIDIPSYSFRNKCRSQ